MSEQDWEVVTIRSSKPKSTTTDNSNGLSQESKDNLNRVHKLESADVVKFKKLDAESRQTLIRARVAKGMKQDQLAHAINMPANIYKSYENGNSIPTQADLNKINNYLKTNLKLI
jgi:ribosome-binding protein aMBF1 (putative translation factor)